MKRNGFTLIELLIVIAIVGIIAAVAIPNIRTAIQRHNSNYKPTSHQLEKGFAREGNASARFYVSGKATMEDDGKIVEFAIITDRDTGNQYLKGWSGSGTYGGPFMCPISK